MNCQEMQNLKHAYADGELDPVRSVEIEEHLKTCAACARAYQNTKALKTAVSSGGLYFNAPPELRRSIRSALRDEAETRQSTARAIARPWFKWAFPLAGTAFAAFVLTAVLLNNSGSGRLAQEVASGHIRSLQAGHIMDVASTDQHTVKPWFDGKLDFAPPVVDLAGQGFPLVGGRLDYLADHPAAALVYQRQKHFINLFVWPLSRDQAGAEESFTLRGYNLIHWSAAGMTFWAV